MTDAELLQEYAKRAAPVCGWPTWKIATVIPGRKRKLDLSLNVRDESGFGHGVSEHEALALWQRHAIAELADLREPQMEIRFHTGMPGSQIEIWLPRARQHVYGPTLDLALIAAVEAIGKEKP